jgi:hypothetical protein
MLHEQVADQERHVLETLAERRQGQGDHAEPEEEVGAEAAARHRRLEVDVGGGDDPDVDRAHRGRAERAHLALLQHPQEPELDRHRDVADLVEEKGAAVGLREQARVVAHRSGEGAAAVAEELAVDERVGQRGAAHGDEGTPLAALVDGAGQKLLAGAALAADQDRHVGSRDLLDLGEQPPHHRGAADHRRGVARAELLLEVAVPALELAIRGGAPERQQHGLDVLERLGHVIERARLERADRGLGAAVAGDDDDRQVRRGRAGAEQELLPLHERHAEVERDQVVLVGARFHLGQGGARVGVGDDLEAARAEQAPEQDQHLRLIVDGEQPQAIVARVGAAGRPPGGRGAGLAIGHDLS